ncbi:restriction endonuclease subunit S [Prevotella pectinovora]|uniref:restriction endonuclease subunit S n=1 Tax=Prevotella pectinovora TaxID=1602169 RepID=UPI003A9365FD
MVNHLGNWKNSELGDFVTLKRGFDLPQQKREDGQVPIFSSSGITGTHSTAMVKAPGVITGRYGTIGEVFYAAKDFWPLNTTLFVEDFHGNDAKFIYYFLKTLEWSKFTSASAVPGINRNTVHKEIVSLPDIETQRRIASTLSMFDEKIKINTEINDNLLDQAQTLYKQHFPYSVQDDLPDGWRIGTVGEIIEIHDSKRIPLSGADRMKMEKKIYPYYGAASLMDYVDNYIFDGKYLLLGEDGTVVDDAGYPILQYVWGQFWVNNHAHILTGRLGFNVESLYMLFKQTPVKSIVTGAVQPKISQANLRSVQVVIPPEHNLKEYNDLVEPLFSLLRANEEECKSLAALRDTLLPKLMSGEIDVSDVQL